jgi:sugar phosphate permease
MSSESLAIPEVSDRASAARLRSLKVTVVVLLFAGYAAYYFCRSDLSVAMPLLIDELYKHGIAKSEARIRIGDIALWGTVAYALGNIFLTGLGDVWGGKRSFTIGLGGAVLFTLFFLSGSFLPVFTIAWIGNRLTQSIGWAGLIKVCSRWFDYSSYGTIIGILSLSFLAGDAVARQSMGMLIQLGFGWRQVFLFAAGVAGLLLILNVTLLRNSRAELGFAEPEVNPLNLFADAREKPNNFFEILKPLLL